MTKRELVLRLLREAGPGGVTTAQLIEARCGSRFGGRIQELRDQGAVIDARRISASSWRYVLRQEAPAPAPADVQAVAPADVAAIEPLPLFELAPAADYRDAA